MTAPDFLGQPETPRARVWQDDAACREIGADPFFAENYSPLDRTNYAPAKRVCRRCPVQAECLDFALRLDIRDGLYGGKTPAERRRIREAS